MVFGISITEYQKAENISNHFSKYNSTSSIVRLTEDVINKEKSNKSEVEVVAIKQDSNWVITSGKSIVYFKKDSFSDNLKFGSKLLV